MNILIAIDSFKGSLSSSQAAQAITQPKRPRTEAERTQRLIELLTEDSAQSPEKWQRMWSNYFGPEEPYDAQKLIDRLLEPYDDDQTAQPAQPGLDNPSEGQQ